MHFSKRLVLAILAFQALPATAQTAPDLAKNPTLYVVGYAHLDTQWRWEYPQVITDYLPATMRDNFALFEKYPHYIFNFSGANRYRLMKEYYPADFAKLKQYVAAGRWFPAGSSMEEGDVNSPSAESIFRQVLYGNHYFRQELGKASAEYMLPDCFGFPASLPSILAEAGVKGFSTQKLVWGSAAPGGPGVSGEDTPVGTPFNVGFWVGPDGNGVVSALNPGNYVGVVSSDLTSDPEWVERVKRNGDVSGLLTDYHYYGTGDVGGAPRETSVKVLEATLTKGTAELPSPRRLNESAFQYSQRTAKGDGVPTQVGKGPLRVVSATAEQMFLDVSPQQASQLPRYQGELELTNHSAGSLTSQAWHKRWNRYNELLASAAESASVAAELLAGQPYPRQALNDAWTLVMGGQFHDLMAGTATPRAYRFTHNDDVVAMNQFAAAVTSASGAVASALDTQAVGVPVVVYNPLSIAREDVVETTVAAGKQVRVVGPDGKEVPSQISDGKVVFLARVPSMGYAVYDVQPSASTLATSLKVSPSDLENQRYRVHIDQNGDISSLYDKKLARELLSAPARLAFQTEKPHDWPAWNMDWEDQQKAPRGFVNGRPTVTVVENGPARVAVRIERESEGSKFAQTVRLAAGDAGNRLEVANDIEWRSQTAALKATFPLSASNREATYNWDVGTIGRGNNDSRKFEVASHQWFDLTDQGGKYGVTVLSDCKYGSDKPDDKTLRLTLLYTPGLGTGGNSQERYNKDQITQDWGRHRFVYGLAGHAEDWRRGETDWQAYRLNQPLLAFQAQPHAGTLGKEMSIASLDNSRVRVLALKKAEDSDEVILRLVETSGYHAPHVHVKLAWPVQAAREVDAQERPLGAAEVADGQLVASLSPNQPRTYALRLGTAPAAAPSRVVSLPYDLAAASNDGTRSVGGFNAAGEALPAEMLPARLQFGDFQFQLAPAGTGKANAVVARGQTLTLPADGDVCVLAAADGDQKATFKVGGQPVEVNVDDWGGYLGQADNRVWRNEYARYVGFSKEITDMQFTGKVEPGFIKSAPLAWYASHRHRGDGKNEPYAYSYLFAYRLPRAAGATTLTLPNNDRVRVLAVSVADAPTAVRPVTGLGDITP